MKAGTLALCMLIVATAALPSAAHDHATGVVKERMDMMKLMAQQMKTIRESIEARRNLTAIKAQAESIAAHAPHIAHLFPPGSTQRPTDATAAIWRNWPDFERKAANLEAESKKLANVTPDDFAALAAQVRAVSQTCGACHETYRNKRGKAGM